MAEKHHGRTVTKVTIAQVATPGALDLVAAVAGVKIYVIRYVITSPAAGTIKFTEGTGPTDLTGAMNFAANGGLVVIGSTEEPVLWTETAGAKLSLVSAGAGSGANGYLHYFLDR